MIISQKEQGLRRRIGTTKLIGCYTLDSNGKAMFTDIRGEQGDCVSVKGVDELTIPYDGEVLKDGEFYAFNWHLNGDGFDFAIDGKPELVDNDEFLKKLFDAKLSLSGSNLELTNNFQRTIFDEVTGAQHTYIYELLQNANDYPYDDTKVRVNFIVTDNYLFFTHTGSPFNLRNVVGITSINQGEKKKNVDTIGYKGIGFKTVFVNNEYVYLRSGGWSFRFDKAFSEYQFAGECPWALMPVLTKEEELDSEVIQTLNALPKDMRVQFALRHKSNAKSNIPQLDKVFSDDQILLFIPNVGCVDVIANGNHLYHVEKDDSHWIVTNFRYTVPDSLRRWVEENIDNGNKVPEKFKDISQVRISFAVSKEGKKIIPVERARVYNYLPTELRLGFGFLINADFIPNGSRSGLHDVEWNDIIMRQVGAYFADWWSSFMIKDGEFDLNSVFDLLPDFNSNDHYGNLFLNGFFERIVQIPCIPAVKNGQYKLCRIDEIIYDRIDFFTQEDSIISDEDFYKFYKTKLYLPHPGIRNNIKFKRLIEKFGLEANRFNVLSLERLVNNNEFCSWLTEPKNNIRFNGFLISSTFIQELRSRALFLRNDGKLGIASKLYENIDRYMVDLDFLDDLLPRLDDSVRIGLTKYKNWESFSKYFMPFDTNKFARMILENFGTYVEWFTGISESIKFTHFLATTFYQGGLPERYPFYNSDGVRVTDKSCLYQRDDIGEDLASRTWINKEWIQFIDSSYFDNDKERVSKFLMSRKVTALSKQDIYTRFINEKSRIPFIAEAIKNEKASVDFYRFLWTLQEYTPFFSPEMRSAYTIKVTDGKNKAWVPISQAIFKKDEDWKNMVQKSWMPAQQCWAIEDFYYHGLTDDEHDKFQSFLAIKQIIQTFTVPGLFNHFSLTKSFYKLFEKIDTIQISKEFLTFLWEYNKDTYKILQKGELNDLPVATICSDDLVAISDVMDSIYMPSDSLLELYNQPWFDKESIMILSTEYGNIFDDKDKRAFFSALGLKRFQLVNYVTEEILPNLDDIRDCIEERENNLSFHRFFASIQAELSEKEAEPLLDMPIYISSPTNPEGVISDYSTDHYLPSTFLTEIIGLDIVPVELLDSIHPDYLQSLEDGKYLRTILHNVDINPDGFIGYIIQGIDEVSPYLHDKKRNINFWRWVADNITDIQTLNKLSEFPILNEGEEYTKPSSLYISNCYVDDDVEAFINHFVKNAHFVSSVYADKCETVDWIKLFFHIGIRISTEEILFKDVIPNLGIFRERFIFLEMAKYVESIKKRINNRESDFINQLSHMQLLCEDGCFRSPKDAIITGQYYDIVKETYSDIHINNIVSEAYITDCKENHNHRRQVIELMKLIGDTFKSKCENSTQLRNKKIEYFTNHQSIFSDESHYRIISELTKDFRADNVGITGLLEKLPKVKLMDKQGKLREATQMHFGSSYNPPCDFERNGITSLIYVSDDYNNGIDNCYSLFCHLGVKGYFEESNIPLLRNEVFAEYFWTEYALTRERELYTFCDYDHLYRVPCIPSYGGIKCPCDLYHTANQRLNSIIEQLPDGKKKQPRINLPAWLNVGLRKRLFIADCLEYLKIETLNYRQDVLQWLFETQDETLQRYRREISDYIDCATWYTGQKTWAPLRTLVALEWADGSSALKESFGGNAFVCNPSNMPETKAAYDKICNIFGIKILSEKDFTKRKSGKCFIDEVARTEIDKRLLYIAYKIDKKDWKTRYADFHKQLLSVDLEKCEQILYYYNDNICSDDIYSYIDDPSTLWYVGEWDGKRFEKVLEWILNAFQLKKYGYTKSSLEKMFEMSVNDYLHKHEGGAMPADFLSMLEEADKKGLDIDKNADYKEGVGDDDTGTLSPEKIKEGHDDLESRRSSVQTPKSQSPTNDSPLSSAQGHRNDQGNTAGRNERTTGSQISHQKHDSSDAKSNAQDPKSSTSRNQRDIPEATEKSLEERMQEKWNKQKEKGVGRPHGAGFRSNTENVDLELNGRSDNISENPNFFSGRKYNRQDQQSQNITRDKSAEDMRRRQTEAENTAERAKEQSGLFEIWQSCKTYSFKWFKYLMELQFQEIDKKLPTPVQIDFHDWTTIDEDQKVLRMICPSRNIPKWLEDAQDVSVTLLGTSSRKLECIIISVDGEGIDLLINPKDLSWINNADKIRINAQNRTNFIDSLQTSFLELGFEDNFQLDDNLPDDIKFIYGPPGTGKTTRLVEILSDLIAESGAHRLQVLVLTPTNKAADVIAEKLFDNQICHDSTVRFGYTDSTKLISGDSNCFQNRDTMDLDDRDENIMVTTIARYAYDTIQPDGTPICDVAWDYIIVDEASMIDIVPITYLLHKAKGSKFIIAGDPKQITPIPQHNMPAYNIYNMVGLDSFKEALMGESRFPVEGLTVQHRSIPVIGNLVSDFCYQGLVKNDTKRSIPKPLDLNGLNVKHLNFLGFKVQELDLLYGLTQINESAFHLYSAIFAYNLVKYIVDQISSKYETPYSIGIVCPYKAQADAIQQMLENRPVDNDQCEIVCGTVHKFQGDECDIMLLVLNPPPKTYSGSHINNTNIINVAMSRARDYIFFLMPEKEEDGYQLKDRLGEIIDNKSRSISFCGDVEKVMFGNPNYIYENTSIQCHQPVNVFYDNRAKYEVRMSDTALDIQIND